MVSFYHQTLKISHFPRTSSSNQQHVLLAGVSKRLSIPIFFLLHTCVTFFSSLVFMVLACLGTQVKLQSQAICPILWELKHSILFMNEGALELLAKLILEDWQGPLYLSLKYALQSFAMCPKFVLK